MSEAAETREGVPINYELGYQETLTTMAEKLGHEGEWQAIALANLELLGDVGELSEAAQVALIFEKARAGTVLKTPQVWTDAAAAAKSTASESSVPDVSRLTASELIDFARSAQSMEELDAIEAAAQGRSTVLAAVASQRSALESSGVSNP